jgi:hypothetical protein
LPQLIAATQSSVSHDRQRHDGIGIVFHWLTVIGEIRIVQRLQLYTALSRMVGKTGRSRHQARLPCTQHTPNIAA